MLGVTPTLKSMQTEAADAKASPAAEGEFKTKRLNLWLNASGAWLSVPQWKACADPTLSWDDFDGLDCWIGGDLADKDDITALVLAAFDAEQRLIFKPVFWLPDAVMQIRRQAEIYAPWTKGRGTGAAAHARRLGRSQRGRGTGRGLAGALRGSEDHVRPVRRCAGMASRINEKHGGNEPLAVILHKKASAVTDPAKELEARVKGGPSRLRHDDNPVMNWMASNVVVARRRDETLLPIKESRCRRTRSTASTR
jgi:phage terminase large subunit-like protein